MWCIADVYAAEFQNVIGLIYITAQHSTAHRTVPCNITNQQSYAEIMTVTGFCSAAAHQLVSQHTKLPISLLSLYTLSLLLSYSHTFLLSSISFLPTSLSLTLSLPINMSSPS